MKKRWVDVPNYRGFYRVSNYGTVRSLTHHRRGKGGCLQIHHGKIIKQWETGGVPGKRYLSVQLSKHGKIRGRYVHRLVWESFNGPIPPGLEVNHKDGNKRNNRLDNLEVGTKRQNFEHAVRNGLHTIFYRRGSNGTAAVLSDQDVAEIRKRLKGIKRRMRKGLGVKDSQTRIASDYGVCKQTITNIKLGRTWQGC